MFIPNGHQRYDTVTYIISLERVSYTEYRNMCIMPACSDLTDLSYDLEKEYDF